MKGIKSCLALQKAGRTNHIKSLFFNLRKDVNGVRNFGSLRNCLFNQEGDVDGLESVQSFELETLNSVAEDTKFRKLYNGISSKPFSEEISKVLLAPLPDQDIEVKPDGILYLPEIKYRRILNKAFGPGGWCLVPKSPYKATNGIVVQEYALFCLGQFVSQSYGEQTFDESTYKTLGMALEGAKSNALMRCCKDIGIASELWDPNFVLQWRKENAVDVYCEHVVKKNTKKIFRRKDRTISYPWVEKSFGSSSTSYKAPSSKPVEIVSDPIMQVVDEVVENNNAEVSMFDTISTQDDGPAQYSTKESSAPSQGNGKGFVVAFDPKKPISFGKFKGSLIDNLIKDQEFLKYLDFMDKKNIQPEFASAARKYIESKK